MNFPINIADELTPEAAYCIGSILSSSKAYKYNNRVYYLAMVKHNSQQVTAQELKQHIKFLKAIAKQTKGSIYQKEKLVERKWFETSKSGFAIVFSSNRTYTASELVDSARRLLQGSDDRIAKAFVVGAYDGRGYWDKRTKRMVLDCCDELRPLLGELLLQFNIHADNNPFRGNDIRNTPREDQFRVAKNDSGKFFEEIGLISPGKIRKVIESAQVTPLKREATSLLPGLTQLIDLQMTRISRKFEKIVKEDLKLDRELEENSLKEIADLPISKTISTRPQYCGKPQEKQEERELGGRKYIPRDKRRAVNALIIADFKCEIDEDHMTFVRRKDGHPYTEPHHLVPLSYSKQFPVSLDVEENIISLCSTCHNHLHYGKDAKELIKKLYEERKELLCKAGIYVSLAELLKMYKA